MINIHKNVSIYAVHSFENMVVFDLCLHRSNIEKLSEQQVIFQIGILVPSPWDQPEIPVKIIHYFVYFVLSIFPRSLPPYPSIT